MWRAWLKRRLRTVITPAFLRHVRTTGALLEAAERLPVGAGDREPLPNLSTWALVCEEVVDTEYAPEYYERVVAELLRRGISRAELEKMRVFAWETAGWLNFEKMLWDWCHLDEQDIRRAIDWQLRDGEISPAEYSERLAYLSRFAPAHESEPPPDSHSRVHHQDE